MSARIQSRGVTLIELLISMAIAGVILAGALALYAQVRGTFRVNERIARMQERGRFALAVIEPDVELAGYYGFTNLPDSVRFVRGAAPETTIATSAELRQFAARVGDAPPAPVAELPSGAHACGVNFAVDVTMPVQGSNDAFVLGRDATCTPYRGRAQAGADTLTIRRVETRTSPAEAGRIQMYASRLTSRTSQLMFADGIAPGELDADRGVHNFVVRAYYVAQDSVGQNNFPALRVKSLARPGTGVLFADDEVMPGVEDLQVEFGVHAADDDNDGAATRYVNPDFADLPRMQVVAARVWLRIRSDEPEVGFDDTKTYRYANVVYTPSGNARSFRRVLMSRTVTLRNARMR